MRSELEKYGIQMPAFSKIGGILANELSVDEAACKSSDLLTNSLLTFLTETPKYFSQNYNVFHILCCP